MERFLANNVYTYHSSFLCFSETHLNSRSFKNVTELKQGWSGIHKHLHNTLHIRKLTPLPSQYRTRVTNIIFCSEFIANNCKQILYRRRYLYFLEKRSRIYLLQQTILEVVMGVKGKLLSLDDSFAPCNMCTFHE